MTAQPAAVRRGGAGFMLGLNVGLMAGAFGAVVTLAVVAPCLRAVNIL